MKTILAAVNSQYIHSNLAVWQLKAACPPEAGIVLVREYNINQQSKWVYSDLVSEQPDVIAMSCYIWNRAYLLQLAADLKAAIPQCSIIFGGPEVSFDYQEMLAEHPYIDGILVGEGETSLPTLLCQLNRGETPELPGFCSAAAPKATSYQTQPDLNALPDPYTPEMLAATKGKILYFESSRGCPFSCSYCLSQISHGVRFLALDRVRETLLRLERAGVTLLKFVDRTFNCNPARAIAIWNFAAKELTTLRLHFEIGADLLDQAQLDVLARMPAGRIQLEAGVQSTNEKTLAAVCRKMDLDKLRRYSKQVLDLGTIHFHMDLIAGLPYEDYKSFGKSFDDVFALRPHQLQLGFLKMLRGSKIRAEEALYHYRFRQTPPYEVISTHCINALELIRLTRLEETLERYYNSGRFSLSLNFLLPHFATPFRFFEALTDTLHAQKALEQSVAAGRQFEMLLSFGGTYLPPEAYRILRELLRCDYLLSGLKGTLPAELITEQYRYSKPIAEAFYAADGFAALGLPRPANKKEMMQRYTFAQFSCDPFAPLEGIETTLLIDSSKRDPVTGRYFSYNISKIPLHPAEYAIK